MAEEKLEEQERQEAVMFLRVRRGLYGDLRDLSEVCPDFVSINAIDRAIHRASLIRFAFAKELYAFANSLDERTSEIVARSKVSRLYYSLHHLLRSVVLRHSNGDTDDHRDCIREAFDIIVKNPDIRSIFGELADYKTFCLELLAHRQAADYEPLGVKENSEEARNFIEIAMNASAFLEKMIVRTQDFMDY